MSMDHPNWGKTEVGSRAAMLPSDLAPVGDPTRWGGEDTLSLSAIGVVYSASLVRIQARDLYSRRWIAAGNILATPDLWATTSDEFRMFLEVTHGAGQQTIRQLFDLRALINLASPWYGTPLEGDRISKPWFIDGGILGPAPQARAIAVTVDAPIVGTRDVTISMIVAPLSAGEGL